MKHVLSIYVEGESVKTALLSSHRKKISIDYLATFPKENVNLLYILESVLAGKRVDIVSGLSPADMLVRDFSLKLTNKRAVLATLPYQMEPHLPYPLKEMVVLPFLHKNKEEKKTDISLCSVKKEALEEHLSQMQQLGMDPDKVSSASHALWRFAKFLFPEHHSFRIFHFGQFKSFYTVIEKDRLCLAQEALLKGDFSKDFDRINNFLKKFSSSDESSWLLTGENPLPLQEQKTIPSLEWQSYAIPIGLALDALSQDKNSLQFRQKFYLSKAQKAKRQKYFLTYLAGCCLASFVLSVGCFCFVKKKEKALSESFAAHFPKNEKASLLENIEEQEKLLAKQKRPFPYHLTTANVSDLLAWLSTHPLAQEIEISQLHYSLVKYPKLGENKDSYIAKIELKFNAPFPRAARQFHEALKTGNNIVNSKEEITWKAHQNTYSTTFFLKRKPL